MELRNKCLLMFVITLVHSLTLMAGKSEGFAPFADLEQTDSLQRSIINDCEHNSHYYGDDDNQRLCYLCIRAFIAGIKQNSDTKRQFVVFRIPTYKPIISFSGDDSKEIRNRRIKDAQDWVKAYDFEDYRLYRTADFIKLIKQNKILILYSSLFDGVNLRITVIGLAKVNAKEVCVAECDYEFELGVVTHDCDYATRTEAIKDFIATLLNRADFVINVKDGSIFGWTDRSTINWQLSDISYDDGDDTSDMEDLEGIIDSLI